ncbi:MAG: nucleotidyltransferase domain-containing protein [Methanobrevibacter sp.]|jgi:predicted nucleotidyltransferase|nr:nucleotidyltransferase domain-containing protein [Candidatus Methanoflexus mossambicus]
MNITDNEMNIILKILNFYIDSCEVFVFGSRLNGDNKPFSDLDLVFKCKKDLKFKDLSEIEYAFSESDLPYQVDIVDYNSASENFQKIIDDNKLKIF